ncbi:HAD family hydrolase [Actinophytocola algeriensis]|uniref:Phosphoglycolate phosphatase-like HAD superfamily hydrolase n=1 Tax=Actinophytocola algeriensis TaxID=1768010 RepID=A0A7W7VHQ5_9PSEU|nr:haloacid dehalogenase-like hydrolase [Actinophytocola algeriensis]MBB4910454.1 phosphoglycolate phosphatase-like HAD superfamily hydrolase [Actinophytocola algeriensis]MBE1480557.1 phosphoglycolate phosphatase-like HAD superfamily hydrolase [Actinophytocola algeriensis]
MRTLVLWDIDLTLVDYSGVGRRWYADALAEVAGVPITHLPSFPGRTERSLAREFLTAHGFEHSDERVERFFAALTALAEQDRPSLPSLGRALAGAQEILSELSTRSHVVQSLVTGNLPVLAGYKLEAFGLHHHIDFEIGGYGSLSEHRHDLVEAAIAQAKSKHSTDFESVVVIGDTPHDVAAGLHHGTTTVGVATGRYTVEELSESGAHVTLRDLSDTSAVAKVLLA